MTRNKLSCKDTCYVGDTNDDYIASLKSKILFIHAKYGFGICYKPKYILNNINELISTITKINNV